MSVILRTITFNHDPLSARRDALNVRRNQTQFVSVPEWVFGLTVRPEQSVAAYAINEIGSNTITIQATFARTDPSIQSVEVRAVHPQQTRLPLGFLNSLISPLSSEVDRATQLGFLSLLWLLHESGEENVLGDVRPKTVRFGPNGQSAVETFELTNPRLAITGIDVKNISWLWQYRLGPADNWKDIVLSQHRIYSILNVPSLPWIQFPYEPANTQLPWVEVLDQACVWARSTTTMTTASTRLTQTLFDLGGEVVTYDCITSGASHYTLGSPFELSFFECTAFLDLLRGGFGNGPYINCVDCATIVSTFANSVGCNLSQVGIFSDFGIGVLWPLNPILAIGSTRWETGACGSLGFVFHSVAITGAGTTSDNVFDACLLVNGNAIPSLPPLIPLLPANERFGLVNEGYRRRLAALAGQANCEVQPITLKRRAVI